MAWYPDAIVKEIPPGSTDPAIIPVGMVFHVRAGTGNSLFPYFNGPSGGIESHFYIRFDGTVEQYRSSTREADANYKGNSWVSGGKRYGLLSVETEGLERGKWTAAQVTSLKRLYRWGMDVHGFPARVCPAWNASGLGYHVLFGAPGPWTPVAKSCPGPERVEQFDDIFRPWLAAGAPLSDTLPDTGAPDTFMEWLNIMFKDKDEFGRFLVDILTGTAKTGTEYREAHTQLAANGTVRALQGDQGQASLINADRIADHGLLDEAANGSTPTGRQVRDDIRTITKDA
jgi:hypothetical protein